jgi:glycosyltransferase involved in cell wall biosynthesis
MVDKPIDLYEERYYLPTDYLIKDHEVISKIDNQISIETTKNETLIPPNRGLATDIPNKKVKMVMITMFKNEAHTIGRMLESCYRYIDYYVIQDNGSTDGTPEVVEKFFSDKNIPGYVYKCEEGWVGFGWNRDHLLQKCQQTDHGCDWILKMDCDETLEVDDDFNWSILEDTSIHAFHIPNVRGGTIYNRAWIWNAKLPWRFNHDTAHETISLEVGNIKENFQRVNLPQSFRHISFDDGQSWSSPTKFLSDALKLEEKLIRENTILEDRYHFWYIGKSYSDAYKSGTFPLQEHGEEYARRTIWYFERWLDYTHDNFTKTGITNRFDEMAYFAGLLIAHAHGFLKDKTKKIEWLQKTEQLCSRRNEHLVNLAETYLELGQYDKMLEVTTKAIRPERKNPFPELMFIIDSNCYYDTGRYVIDLHNRAIEMTTEQKPQFNLSLNLQKNKRVFVVDNFYSDPDSVRNYALGLDFAKDLRWYKGLRTTTAYRPDQIKKAFEEIIGQSITNWEEHGFNGVFQLTTAEDPQVYHYDSQKWAAMIYLTPNAPIHSGTRLHKSLITGARNADEEGADGAFTYGFYDSTKFDVVDDMGNIYNRCVIMDARNIHSAGPYFGQNLQNGRLIHLFFFD